MLNHIKHRLAHPKRNQRKMQLMQTKQQSSFAIMQSLKVKILAGHWTTNLLRQNGRLFQLCKNENHTLEAFIAARRLSAKFDCPVARQNCSLLAAAYDCETSFI